MLEDTGESTTDRFWNYFVWFFIAGMLIRHLYRYLPRVIVPHYDYFNVMQVINYYREPTLFAGDALTEIQSYYWSITAPIYFQGITYPLSFLLPSKWVLLIIGTGLVLVCTWFAGGSWSGWRNGLTALFMCVILLHISVTPLDGNRRSFTAAFVLGTLWLDESTSYWAKLFLLGLAAGIYPPAALIAMTYWSLTMLIGLYRNRRSFQHVLSKLLGFLVVFLLVLTPFWTNLLFVEDLAVKTDVGSRVTYQLGSLGGWWQSFIVGTRGALFREGYHLNVFLVLLGMAGLQWSFIGSFKLKRRHRLLLITSLSLWSLAHLTHPLIYHPFKYTRVCLLIALALPIAENIPEFVHQTYKELAQYPVLRLMLYSIILPVFGIWTTFVLHTGSFIVLIQGVLEPIFWKFILAVPILLIVSCGYTSTGKKTILRSFLVVVLFYGFVFLPHGFPKLQWRDMHLSNFDGLYEFLKTTPPGTMVAGPTVYYVDPIPAFGKRPIYGSSNKILFRFVCQRNRKFWRHYYMNSSAQIVRFMRQAGIDYLLVDRKLMRNPRPIGVARCVRGVQPDSDPYLNRHFEEAAWSYKNRFYLVHRRNLSSS